MNNNELRRRFEALRSRPTTTRPTRQAASFQRPQEPANDKQDIFQVWEDQKRMQAEDKRLQEEIEAAKKKAKELKRTLRKNQLGEASGKLVEYSSTFKDCLKPLATTVSKQTRNFGKRRAVVAVLVLVVGLGGIALFSSGKTKDQATPSTLGEVSIAANPEEDLVKEDPKFPLLYPEGRSSEQYDVIRISPPNTAASYTYLDRFTADGEIFRVTQQEIPESFDLAKTATDFQATSIIQIDDTTVYHGYSERGGIQSLIFTKNDRLVSIRSPKKFSDDAWASYVASMKITD